MKLYANGYQNILGYWQNKIQSICLLIDEHTNHSIIESLVNSKNNSLNNPINQSEGPDSAEYNAWLA